MSPFSSNLILPAAQAWEVWSVDSKGTVSTPVAVERPDLVQGPMLAVGIPARYLTALPLWLVNADPALYEDMVRLQLERRGLLTGGAAFRWKIISSTDSRVLFLACVLSKQTAEEIHLENASRFEPSPALRLLPEAQLVLMRESERLVAVCGRDGELAAFQCLGDKQITLDILIEVQSLLLQLAQDLVFPVCNGITLWGELSEDEQYLLANGTGLPVTILPAPVPALPKVSWNLTPPAVEETRSKTGKRKTQRSLMTVIGCIWLFLAVLAVGHYGWLRSQEGRLRADIQKTAPMVDKLKIAAARWRALELAIEPDLYPVERLYRAAQQLRPDGVRFTLYDQRGATLLIRGEGKNAPAAFRFRDSFENDPDWIGFRWQMPQPRLLPNNSAQFQLEGNRGNASTDTK